MAAYDAEGNLIEGTESRVVKLEHKFSYWGDGDGTYYWQAVVATDEGYTTMRVGKDCWNGHGGQADLMGTKVDAPQGVIDNYPVWQEEQDEKRYNERQRQVIASDSQNPYYFSTGKLGIVMKGKRGRKHEGSWGHIVWIGSTRYGERCGIKNPETEEVAWVPTAYVSIVPDYDDFEPVKEA